jgi:guanylate kinase
METEFGSGLLVVISAPSGTGKTTVIGEILRERPEFKFSISATTRARRDAEEDGRDYHFISREEFADLVSRGEFLEYAQFAGDSYGTPRAPVVDSLEKGDIMLLDIDVQGAKKVREKIPEALSIFIAPPNIAELERRLRGRNTDSEEKLQKRLTIAASELENAGRYDRIVINEDVHEAAREILSIIDRRRSSSEPK